MPSSDPVEIPEVEAIAAFEELKGALEALDETKLRALRFPASEAASRGLWLAGNAERDRSRFEAQFTSPPLEAIDSLRKRALAVKGAELTAAKAATAPEPPDLDAARSLRRRHLKVVDAVLDGEPEHEAAIAQIVSGRGTRDLGSDLVELAAMERKQWARISATGLVNEAELERMDQLGVDVLRWAGRKDEPGAAADPRAAERRAFTYLAEAYDLVRDHARLVYRDDPDAWQRDYPSLYTHEATPSASS